MTRENIIQKLAIERCKLHISHLLALQHLLGGRGDDTEEGSEHLTGLFEHLNRDLELIENLIAD